MIDLHSHLLPGCDDGAENLETAIAMAKMAVSDGVKIMVCTPHIMPGLYDNDASGIRRRVADLQNALTAEKIDLQLAVGADVHIAPDLLEKLKAGVAPTLNGSRYFLFEPPHHVLPPNLEKLVHRLVDGGYVPILTHPERLGWASTHYEVIDRINAAGCLVQITAGSLMGSFGRRAQALAERMLEEGRVDIIASDAHNLQARSPGLSKAHDLVGERWGKAIADDVVLHTPAKILANQVVTPAHRNRSVRVGQSDKAWTKTSKLRRFVGWIRNA